MADEKTGTEVEEKGEEVVEEEEGSKNPDETPATETPSETTEEKPEEEGTEGKTEETTQPLAKRFKIAGETPEEYLKNLEDAYGKSSSEGVRLNQELKETKSKVDKFAEAVANDPELAERIEKGEGVLVHPALRYAEDRMLQEQEKEYQEFLAGHPEIESDPAVQQKLLEELAIIGEGYIQKGKMLNMKKGLTMAWNALEEELGLNKKSSEEELALKAKETAGATQTASGKKTETKSEFSESQLKIANRLGITEEKMREYVKSN